jgi:hypothetical protein
MWTARAVLQSSSDGHTVSMPAEARSPSTNRLDEFSMVVTFLVKLSCTMAATLPAT